jgi:hypothetical protein
MPQTNQSQSQGQQSGQGQDDLDQLTGEQLVARANQDGVDLTGVDDSDDDAVRRAIRDHQARQGGQR